MAININDIIEQYGKYYLNSDQNRDRIKGVPFIPSETLSIPGMTHIKTKDTIYQMANPIYQKLLQQFQNTFTQKGGVTYKANEVQLRHVKADLEIIPHDIEESWMGFLAGDSSRTIETWPIVRYIIEVYMAQMIAEERETSLIYKGKYEAPIEGTAGEGSKAYDGYRELLKAGADNEEYPINVIEDIGVLEYDTAFDQIELFSKEIASQFRNRNINIFVAPEFERAYLEGKRAKGFYNISGDSQIGTKIDFTRHTIIGLESMAGTSDIWATMPDNLYHITKRTDDINNLDIQKLDRIIKMLMDWWEAVGLGCNKLVWASRNTLIDDVADPTMTRGTGADKNKVTLACATDSATIKYTTDGSDPVESGSTYSEAITVSAEMTIKAYATKSGMDDSHVVSKHFKVLS